MTLDVKLDIKEKINQLPEEKRKEFSEELTQNLYDENWCERNHIDYKNPDMEQVKEILFNEGYAKYIPA